MFENRRDAGRKLSERLEKFCGDRVIVLAVPRGGVVVAFDTIKRYGFEWDLIIPRKIGAPRNKEMAIGAVSASGSYFVDRYYVEMLNIPESYIQREVASEMREIRRRLKEYKGDEALPDVRGKTVIIIDDGIATGFTIQAAVKSLQNQGTGKIVLAVPVGPEDTLKIIRRMVDEVVCLLIPEEFYAVGKHYREFGQVSDEEVFDMIKELKG